MSPQDLDQPADWKREVRRVARATIMERSKTFGEALARARQKAGFTQSQLSSATGFPQSTISAWERDDIQPSNETVFQLERTLRAKPGSLSQLLGFAPVGVRVVSTVEAAVMADPTLDPHSRELLLQIYEKLRD